MRGLDIPGSKSLSGRSVRRKTGILLATTFAIAALFLGAPLTPARAQQQDRVSDVNGHSWYMYFGDHRFGEGPWGLHFDGQLRRQGIGQKWQQLLLRPGVNYDLSERVQLSGGYVFVKSHPYGDFPASFTTPSHSLWEQVIVKHPVGRATLMHRYRFEQRWVGVKVADESGKGRLDRFDYRNRFRYFLKGVIPLREDDAGNTKFFLSLYNEIMINFGSNSPNIFDQNRAYGALGFRLGSIGNLEIGYLQQTVQQSNGRVIEYNHTFQLGLFSNLPFGE